MIFGINYTNSVRAIDPIWFEDILGTDKTIQRLTLDAQKFHQFVHNIFCPIVEIVSLDSFPGMNRCDHAREGFNLFGDTFFAQLRIQLVKNTVHQDALFRKKGKGA